MSNNNTPSSAAEAAHSFAKGSWQHAVDDALVGYGRTSEEFESSHAAVAWLLSITGDAAIACRGAECDSAPKKLRVTLQDNPTERMLDAAVWSLAQISKALDIPDEEAACANGNGLILEAIAELKARATPTGVAADTRLSVLASFAHEIALGAIHPKLQREAALTALRRTDLERLDDVVALVAADESTRAPDGWKLTRHADGAIVVWKDGLGGYAAVKDHDSIAVAVLWELANDLLSAPPSGERPSAPAPEGEKRLRDALEMAVRQNEHDMLLTGEELRQCRAALSGEPVQEKGGEER